MASRCGLVKRTHSWIIYTSILRHAICVQFITLVFTHAPLAESESFARNIGTVVPLTAFIVPPFAAATTQRFRVDSKAVTAPLSALKSDRTAALMPVYMLAYIQFHA
jgi:hypothetical protein